MSGSSERYLPYIAVSIIGTALIYAARLVSAGDTEDDSHLRPSLALPIGDRKRDPVRRWAALWGDVNRIEEELVV